MSELSKVFDYKVKVISHLGMRVKGMIYLISYQMPWKWNVNYQRLVGV